MYDIITIRKPVENSKATIKINSLSMIPEFLRKAITVVNCQLHIDSIGGGDVVPLGSLIAYEECGDLTPSGYNCWQIKESKTVRAMLIPAKEDIKPLWVNACNLIYNGDGTATIRTQHGQTTGRIGIDFILCHGMRNNGSTDVSILATYDEDYNDYIICNEAGIDISKLCDLYPA